jgi:hypothetical protein
MLSGSKIAFEGDCLDDVVEKQWKLAIRWFHKDRTEARADMASRQQ